MTLDTLRSTLLTALTLLTLTVLAGCASSEGMTPGDCTDGLDNDGDGDRDCADSGCSGSPDCAAVDDDDTTSPDDDDTTPPDDDDDTTPDDDDTSPHGESWDAESAHVVITAPNWGYDLATEASTITLEGLGREDVVAVSWTTSGGASGAADGTLAWTATDIPLEPGDNLLTVTGTDSDGDDGEETMAKRRSSSFTTRAFRW